MYNEGAISKREIFLSIVMFLLVMGFAILVEPLFKDHLSDQVKIYEQSLKIDNDPNMFSYALQTEVGNIMAQGTMEAKDPVKLGSLVNSYSIVEKVFERYTMHTRESCSGSGTKRTCHTETYWTWDHVRTDSNGATQYTFLGKEFGANVLNLDTNERLDLSKNLTDVEKPRLCGSYVYENSCFSSLRWYYRVLPKSFNVTLSLRAFEGKITNFLTGGKVLQVSYNAKIADILQSARNSLVVFDWIYYATWLLVSGAFYFWYAKEHLNL